MAAAQSSTPNHSFLVYGQSNNHEDRCVYMDSTAQSLMSNHIVPICNLSNTPDP